MNTLLNTLNCNNYHVADSDNEHWYAQNGLRSLYEYSKISDKTFKAICIEMLAKKEVILKDTRNNGNDILVLTLI